jgi:hypothetical protein
VNGWSLDVGDTACAGIENYEGLDREIKYTLPTDLLYRCRFEGYVAESMTFPPLQFQDTSEIVRYSFKTGLMWPRATQRPLFTSPASNIRPHEVSLLSAYLARPREQYEMLGINSNISAKSKSATAARVECPHGSRFTRRRFIGDDSRGIEPATLTSRWTVHDVLRDFHHY